MTPERIEKVKKIVGKMNPGSQLLPVTAKDLLSLLAALEEAHQREIKLAELLEAEQDEVSELESELAEAQQTIARLSSARAIRSGRFRDTLMLLRTLTGDPEHVVKDIKQMAENALRSDDRWRDTDPREPVQWFSEQMEWKLRHNEHKDHWRYSTHDYLIGRIYDECIKLEVCLGNDSPEDEVIKEAADIANFAMMIADNAREALELKDKEAEEGETQP